jgi:hypothetical protein
MTRGDDDRLVSTDALGPAEPMIADTTEDVMDDTQSVVAQQFESMLQQSTQSHRQQIMQQVKQPPKQTNQTTPDYWFMSNSPVPKGTNQAAYRAQTVLPGSEDAEVKTDDHGAAEQALLSRIHEQQEHPDTYNTKMKVVRPLSDQSTPAPTPPAASAKPVNPDILRLANNDDLNVSTLAREANRSSELNDDGEVVISLR